MKLLIIFALLIMVLISDAETKCMACTDTPERCPNNKEPKDCSYGVVTDRCNCCKVCARGPGQQCGGTLCSVFGKCGKGLECVVPANSENGKGKCRRA